MPARPRPERCALAAEVARVIARGGDLEALLEAVGQPQESDAVRSAEPFLARPRVGVHAQRGGVDVDRAHALGAVHQHRRSRCVRCFCDLAQRQDAAVRPEHVRERHQPRARPDQRGDRVERIGAVQRLGDAHDDAVAADEGRERLEQARVLVVGRDDLVAGREVEAAEHEIHAAARRVRQRDALGIAAHGLGDGRARSIADALELGVAGGADATARLDLVDARPHGVCGARRQRAPRAGVEVHGIARRRHSGAHDFEGVEHETACYGDLR